jgi:hypothetical protein
LIIFAIIAAAMPLRHTLVFADAFSVDCRHDADTSLCFLHIIDGASTMMLMLSPPLSPPLYIYASFMIFIAAAHLRRLMSSLLLRRDRFHVSARAAAPRMLLLRGV